MDLDPAVDALSALAHPTRLKLFRLLMRAGPSGQPAGDLALSLGLSNSTLSFHLTQLTQAGLLRATRHYRHIFYAVDIDQTRRLMRFLSEDCCAGNPEICGAMTVPACAPEPEAETEGDR